jgi:proteasome accessory factor A
MSDTPHPADESLTASGAPLLSKLCGGDLELSNFILGPDLLGDTTYRASRALLHEFEGVPGRGYRESSLSSAGSLAAGRAEGNEPDGSSQDWGRKFLFNGGCAYVDLNHLEVCLPEVLSARDHVAASHAMYQLAHRAARAASARLPAGQKIQVLANNSDGLGHSFGSHLNVYLSRPAWENIFHRRLHYQLFLASYQASSLVFTGLGKVGSENGTPAVSYQLSQRADFCEMLAGAHTTHERPIVNMRDEPLCGGWGLRRSGPGQARLHVIFYDHNLCHVAGLLKIGVLQIIVAMIEAGQVSTQLLLEDPVSAVVRWSHDPTLQARATLMDGRERTAVELQLQFLQSARLFVESGACDEVVPHAAEIVELWADTLEKLQRGDLAALAPRLDWVLKLASLQNALRQRPALNWQSPELKHLDHLYSSLDPAEGLYWGYARGGFVQELVTEREVTRLITAPPTNTRAWTRATLLLMAEPAEVDWVDWDFLRFRLQDPIRGHSRYFSVHLDDPLRWTRDEAQQRFPHARRLPEALGALEAVEEFPSRTDSTKTASVVITTRRADQERRPYDIP